MSTESATTHRRHVTWLGLIVAVAVITTGAVGSDTRGAAVPTYAVTVQVASGVGGSISTAIAGATVGTCRTACTYQAAPGSAVGLTAAPDQGWLLADWSPPCRTTTTVCRLGANGDVKVTALFNPTVQVTTSGPGTVTGPGIDCGTTCTASYPQRTKVPLTATPSPGATFAGWSGSCSGSGSCTLALDGPRSVGASFTGPKVALANVTVVRTGSAGTVTSSPAGISCGPVCTGGFAPGTTVTLQAASASNSFFVGWSGACTGAGNLCPVTAGSLVPATATFGPITASPTFRQVEVTVSGAGSVVSDPDGIDCGATCDSGFPSGQRVSLQAKPAPGYTFDGWDGGCSHTSVCVVVAGTDAPVAARFRRVATLTALGSGPGRVVVAVAKKQSCSAPCAPMVSVGTSAVLTAAPARGAHFVGWSGACVGTATRCALTLDGDARAVARFKSGAGRRAAITITRSLGGTVTSSPAAGTGLRLRAVPAPGFSFAGWGGACSGTAARCSVQARHTAVTATFRRVYRLTLATVGDGQVTTSLAPAPRTLQRTADAPLALNSSQTATATATPKPGSRFVGWSGSCSGSAPTCTVAADSEKQATATFEPGESSSVAYAVNVTRVGSGVVMSEPPGISCGDREHCQKAWQANQRVKLTAHQTPDSRFTGWAGACTGGGECIVKVPASDAVIARFEETGAKSCSDAPALNATLRVSVRRKPRSLRVVVVPSTPTAVLLRLGRPGLLVIDSKAQLDAGRNAVPLPVARTTPGGLYLFTARLTDGCGRTKSLPPRPVRLPRVGK